MLRAIVIDSFDKMKKYISIEIINKHLDDIYKENFSNTSNVSNISNLSNATKEQLKDITDICNKELNRISLENNEQNIQNNSNVQNVQKNQRYENIKQNLINEINTYLLQNSNHSNNSNNLNVLNDLNNNQKTNISNTFSNNNINVPKELYKKCRDTLDENKRFIIREPNKIIDEMREYCNNYKKENIQDLNKIVYTVSLELKQKSDNTAIYRISQQLNKQANLNTINNQNNKMDLKNNGLVWLMNHQKTSFNSLFDKPNNTFLNSLLNELKTVDDPHTNMFITTKMNILSLLKLQTGNPVNISKNSIVGFFNKINGTGTNFDINLNNDIELCKEDTNSIQIENSSFEPNYSNVSKNYYTPLNIINVKNKIETMNIDDFLTIDIKNIKNEQNDEKNISLKYENNSEQEINNFLNENNKETKNNTFDEKELFI